MKQKCKNKKALLTQTVKTETYNSLSVRHQSLTVCRKQDIIKNKIKTSLKTKSGLNLFLKKIK